MFYDDGGGSARTVHIGIVKCKNNKNANYHMLFSIILYFCTLKKHCQCHNFNNFSNLRHTIGL